MFRAAVLALLSTQAWAQEQRPLPKTAPQVFVASRPRVHIRAHEDLDPDRLRELARPGVTLWLSTQSNTLRASTVENVARFDRSWVQLRAPLQSFDARVFSKMPTAGLWLDLASASIARRVPGVRQLAVSVYGPLDAQQLRIFDSRAAEVRWTPTAPVDVLTWGLFRQFPGRKIVVANSETLLSMQCAQQKTGEPSMEVHVASLLTLSSGIFPCGSGTRVIVDPLIDDWLLQSLLVRDPSVELVVEVGGDSKVALATRGLLDRLQLGKAR